MSDRPTITVHAPAKLNLALSVGPPEASGMHPISSWMITVDLVDELHITRLEDDRLSRYAILWHPEARRQREIDWSITSDLAVRAHRALETRAGRRLPVQLKVTKRIPVGGGLGGGSSNAAAMLRAVNEMFELGIDRDELVAIGAALGSDVPFLLDGGSAVVGGTGDRLDPHPVNGTVHAVIVFPEAACPTGAVYEAFDCLGGATLQPQAVSTLCAAGAPVPETLFNDLTPAALRIAPELADMLSTLATMAERPAHLSGSGSSLFVICDDPIHAESLAAAVETRMEMPAVAVRSLEVTHAGAA